MFEGVAAAGLMSGNSVVGIGNAIQLGIVGCSRAIAYHPRDELAYQSLPVVSGFEWLFSGRAFTDAEHAIKTSSAAVLRFAATPVVAALQWSNCMMGMQVPGL
jgi:hypothetical protein